MRIFIKALRNTQWVEFCLFCFKQRTYLGHVRDQDANSKATFEIEG